MFSSTKRKADENMFNPSPAAKKSNNENQGQNRDSLQKHRRSLPIYLGRQRFEKMFRFIKIFQKLIAIK